MKQEWPTPLAFNVRGAVQYTGMSRSKLYESIADGQLQSAKVGGRRRFLRVDLDKFVHRLHGKP